MAAKLHKLTEVKEGAEVRVADFYYDSETEVIYFVKRMDGALVRFSTGVKRPNIRKAKEVANFKLRGKLNRQSVVRMLLGDLMDQYIEQSEKDARRGEINESTVVKRRQIMRKLRPFWENKRPEEITADTWGEYIDWYEEEYPGERLFDTRKYMRHFARYLNQRTVNGRPILQNVPLLKNPFAAKERKSRQRKKERVLSADEIKLILKASDERTQIIVLLMYTMAFRINEACALKWANIDFEGGVYRFRSEDNKAGHEGSQAIHPMLLERLKAWPKRGPYVFPQEKDEHKAIRSQMIDWKEVKLKSKVAWHWTPHTFRHTCLTQLFTDPTKAHAVIMKCFRISYKTALEHYVHISDETRDSLRSAISLEGIV